MRARYYDPEVGRFVNKDPIGYAGGMNLYGYVANKLVNFIDPSGLTLTSNWNFFWDWVLGGGERERSYDPNSIETQEMRNSIGVQNLRNEFRKGGCKSITRGEYGTYEAYWDYYVNPFTADPSSTAFQVGGFSGASVINNGNGTVTFTITNVAGTYSFFLHGVPDRKSTTGPMRSIIQNFQWTEPIVTAK
jgi:hypothetical protein